MLIYMIVLLLIGITIKYVRPFKTYHKLQRLTPLLIIFLVVPITIKFPLSSTRPVPVILALILIISSIWSVRKNFKADKGNTESKEIK